MAEPSDYGPTLAADINALPQRLRSYVHDLETRADPTWDVRRAYVAEENTVTLEALVQELRAELDHARKVAGDNAANVVTLMLERDALLAEIKGLRGREHKRVSGLESECDRWQERLLVAEERERQLREAIESQRPHLKWLRMLADGLVNQNISGNNTARQAAQAIDAALAALSASPATVESEREQHSCSDPVCRVCGEDPAVVGYQSPPIASDEVMALRAKIDDLNADCMRKATEVARLRDTLEAIQRCGFVPNQIGEIVSTALAMPQKEIPVPVAVESEYDQLSGMTNKESRTTCGLMTIDGKAPARCATYPGCGCGFLDEQKENDGG